MSRSPVNPPDGHPPRRAYRTPKRDERAAATRTAIREAAEALFLRDGYTRTSMKAIADRAGVSEKTMYLHFATKATLLLQVVQISVRGDEAPGALANRPDWKALISGPADEMLERFATRSARLMARSAPIIALAEAAADADPELAAYRDRVHEVNREEISTLVAAFKRHGVLAPGIDDQDAADTIYALAGNELIYLRLTRECAWTEARYATFIARTLKATLGRR
jgi:AcrR family transcriptional regulator